VSNAIRSTEARPCDHRVTAYKAGARISVRRGKKPFTCHFPDSRIGGQSFSMLGKSSIRCQNERRQALVPAQTAGEPGSGLARDDRRAAPGGRQPEIRRSPRDYRVVIRR
jgi:hypothetical protein